MLSKEEIFKEDAILAGQKLFQQFGFHKTTMEDIANEMGRAKSTLYYYYKSKEEVFDAVVHSEMRNMRMYVKDEVEQHTSMIDKVNTYIMEFYKEVTNKVNLYRIIKKELMSEPIAQKYFSLLIDYEKEYMIKILQEGYDSGEYKLFGKDDIRWEAEMFLAALFGIVQYSVERDSVFNETNLQKITNTILPNIF